VWSALRLGSTNKYLVGSTGSYLRLTDFASTLGSFATKKTCDDAQLPSPGSAAYGTNKTVKALSGTNKTVFGTNKTVFGTNKTVKVIRHE